jgi:sugar lactone lactonase YvrE
VLYYDGQSFRKVAQALAYANGINISSDGQTVYVAATCATCKTNVKPIKGLCY